MFKKPPIVLRVAYCFVILCTILPLGFRFAAWVTLDKKHIYLGSTISFFWPLLFLALGAFRVYWVARFPTALSSPPVSGIAAVLRALGLMAIYVGVFANVLKWLCLLLIKTHVIDQAGAALLSLVLGIYLPLINLITSLGLAGILLFEFSRILAFEKLLYQHHIAQKSNRQRVRGTA